jgi:hypothetical protein
MTSTATLTGVRDLPPAKLAKDVKPLEFVDHSKTYRVVLQIGPLVRWRRHKGGTWENVKDDSLMSGRNTRTQPTGDYRPAIQETDPIMGSTVNGLIQWHNDWLKANTERQGSAGLLNRQLVVLEVKETKEAPADKPVDMTMSPSNIAEIAAATARAVVDQMMKGKGEK